MTTLKAYPCNYVFSVSHPLVHADELPCWVDYATHWDREDKCTVFDRLEVRYIVYGGAVYSAKEFYRLFGTGPNDDSMADLIHEHGDLYYTPDYTPLASVEVGDVTPAQPCTVKQALLEQARYYKAQSLKFGDFWDDLFNRTMAQVNEIEENDA